MWLVYLIHVHVGGCVVSLQVGSALKEFSQQAALLSKEVSENGFILIWNPKGVKLYWLSSHLYGVTTQTHTSENSLKLVWVGVLTGMGWSSHWYGLEFSLVHVCVEFPFF